MGGGQSKDSVSAQATVNNSIITQRLDAMSWVIIALVAILGFVIGYVVWHRCRTKAKGWVRRQVTDSNLAVVSVQAVPRQQPAPMPQYAS